VSLHNLSGVLIDAGDLSGTETTAREVQAIRRKILGNDHPELYYSLNNLGWILLQEGDWKSAEPFLLENLRLVSKLFGEASTKMVIARKNWGLLRQQRGDYAGARQSFHSALETAQKNSRWRQLVDGAGAAWLRRVGI
jgi:tetratricopeptide (TPR) repeat protein